MKKKAMNGIKKIKTKLTRMLAEAADFGLWSRLENQGACEKRFESICLTITGWARFLKNIYFILLTTLGFCGNTLQRVKVTKMSPRVKLLKYNVAYRVQVLLSPLIFGRSKVMIKVPPDTGTSTKFKRSVTWLIVNISWKLYQNLWHANSTFT